MTKTDARAYEEILRSIRYAFLVEASNERDTADGYEGERAFVDKYEYHVARANSAEKIADRLSTVLLDLYYMIDEM